MGRVFAGQVVLLNMSEAGILDRLLDALTCSRSLPDPLPAEPFGIFRTWFEEAVATRRDPNPNPNAMSLATIGADGLPACRIVLCKSFDADAGTITFFTNYKGRKGRDLAANPRAAVCFHWDAAERQVRIEGPVTRASEQESDAYFATRPWDSRIGAWASSQSEPLASRADLIASARRVLKDLGISLAELAIKGNAVSIPRPPHWGGFVIKAARVELWLGGPGRFHDRAAWTREVSADCLTAGPWSATRLQP
jgi:pyridoxamine 5'-phosphate oxidase